ncbi:MAG: hypothetical protein E6J45_09080 [Chloroflexi bacterium]|nr:MAG: hypothetical protein E6J45_09080 [Chloroflexota bacterium]
MEPSNFRRAALTAAMAGAVAGGLFFSGAQLTKVGAGTPADKVTVAGSTLTVMPPNSTATVLQASMKTSNPEDLVLQVTAECSIVTNVTATSNGGAATGSGEVDVQVKIDGVAVPIVSVPGQNAQKPPSALDDGRVVFCNRVFTMTITTSGASSDTINTYEKSKATNAFNWAAFNIGSTPSPHVITVEATFSTSDPNQQAVIGNRTLIVTPTSLALNQTG